MKYIPESVVHFFEQSGKTDPFAIAGLCLGIIAYIPYLWSVIITREAKPAISSWFLWSLLTVLTFFGSYKTGKVYPQTLVYLVLDPCVLICAIIARHSSPFDKWDKRALYCGLLSIPILVFFPAESLVALIVSLVGIAFANVPVIKNVYWDPLAENMLSWILFTLAGASSFLSSVLYFTKWEDMLTPFIYMTLCLSTLGMIIRGKYFGPSRIH